ncbi:MAG: hypothetical protein FWD57_07330 [Polyangiaceae bacterium]|nr:hypothetical protein [Polyangiaceae bacterium]
MPQIMPESHSDPSLHRGAQTPLEHVIPDSQDASPLHLGSQTPFQHAKPDSQGDSELHAAAHCLLMLHILSEPQDSPIWMLSQSFVLVLEQDRTKAKVAKTAVFATLSWDFVPSFIVMAPYNTPLGCGQFVVAQSCGGSQVGAGLKPAPTVAAPGAAPGAAHNAAVGVRPVCLRVLWGWGNSYDSIYFNLFQFISIYIDLYRFISIYIDLYRFISIYIDYIRNRCGIIRNYVWVNPVRLMYCGGLRANAIRPHEYRAV